MSAHQGMRFRRKASATAWTRLRTPSFSCAFFRWLRTVSPPILSASATSRVRAPVEAQRKTAISRGVSRAGDSCTRPGRVTCSKRSAERLAAAKIRLRICSCRIFSERVLRDQKMITHLPPTGQQKASRIPYLRNKSSDHRSFPVGSNTCFASDHVHGAMLDCARNSSRRNLPRATASYSSHQPLGTPLCRKMESPS